VVGASVAGVNAVDGLREAGFDGEVLLVGAENHRPYDRPPLSKQLLAGQWDSEQVRLRPVSHYADLGIELRLGVSATALDLATRTLRTGGGEVFQFDGIVIATGARPRVPRFVRPLEGVHLLRTLDDAWELSSALLHRPNVIIVGAGFIGSEVAATARGLGCDVTVLEALASPMAQAVGPVVGERLGRLHAENGVSLLCNASVAGLVGDTAVQAVQLEDGARIPADVVVVGTGVSAATEWLESSGLTLSDGVVCDELCRAAFDVYAAGDTARWTLPSGSTVRVEHWTNATEQGRHAARNLAASMRGDEQTAYDPTPYFWSDQYLCKIQMLGWPSPEVEILALAESRIAVLYSREQHLCGALTLSAPRLLAALRPLVSRRAPLADARRVVVGSPARSAVVA